MAKQYTIEQFLAAAEQAEVSMIAAKHICDTLVKMNSQYRKMIENSIHFKKDDIVKVFEVDEYAVAMKYRCINKYGITEWILNYQHEPTTETF